MENINTNINQIIFPKDMELRKVRKKPKKKAPNKKKIALDNLKAVLQNFDAVINEAKQKNISIPAELGKLPSNINEIDSIKEIEELTSDLTNRIAQIQALIQKGSSLTQAKNLFGFDLPQRAGVFPTPQPFLPQTIIPAREPPVLPSGGERPIVPSGITPAISDDAEKDLDVIKKEILDKLTPEQRAQAEAELEKEKAEGGKKPPPSTPIEDLNLEKNIGVKYGKRTFDMIAPVGFYDIFRRYRQFIENLQFNSIKIKDGFYNIPETKYTGLENQRINILKDFNNFNNNLNPKQIQYIDNSPTLSEIEELMDNTLLEDLEDILKQELTKQGVKVDEVSGGKTPSKIEQEEKANPEFVELLKSTQFKADNLTTQFENASDISTLMSITSEINTNLIPSLDKKFNSLSGEEKTASLTPYNNLKALLDDLAGRKIPIKIEQIRAEQKTSGKPSADPISPVSPVSPPLPEPDEVAGPPTDPSGDGKPLRPVERPFDRDPSNIPNVDIAFLVKYATTRANFSKKTGDALKNIGVNHERIIEIRDMEGDNINSAYTKKKKAVKQILLNKGVDARYFEEAGSP